MQLNIYQVDAFARRHFEGNPAAVCPLKSWLPDNTMQRIAEENNLSETAFLLPEGEGWRLRWFTPRAEVNLCGHATLASARVLFELHPGLRVHPLHFHTLSGLLKARWVDDRVEMDFPVMQPEPMDIPMGIETILGVGVVQGVRSDDYYLLEVESEQAIREAKPDFQNLSESEIPEVMITAMSDNPAFDFVSRFFAPRLGIDEDPVTGSAHCLLAPYWSEKLGKKSFKAYQASSRGGILHVELRGERVLISGSAQIILSADLLI